MSKPLYRQLYDQMLAENEELFERFRCVHEAYAINHEANQMRFNEVGGEVLKLVQQTEARLCRQTEKGGYGRYSTNLAEKFRDLIRKEFGKIDMVGVK
jgi:gamma-glutamylcysteine synthetase